MSPKTVPRYPRGRVKTDHVGERCWFMQSDLERVGFVIIMWKDRLSLGGVDNLIHYIELYSEQS